MVGHIQFFRPVSYWDAYELSYQLYGQEHAGQGYTTEAVRLLVDYLFGAEGQPHLAGDRARERPEPADRGEVRIPARGTARGALFNGGRSVDVLIYALLRDDPRPWHTSD